MSCCATYSVATPSVGHGGLDAVAALGLVALQMIGAGAAGETAAQLTEVLHLPEGARPRLPAFGQTNLKVSNTAWAQHGLKIKPGSR